MKIYFLLEFGLNHGLGHLARCSNLANHLKKISIESGLITTFNSFDKHKKNIESELLKPFAHDINYFTSLEDQNQANFENIFFKINKIISNNILIIDHYYLSRQFVKKLKNFKFIFHFKDDINDIDILENNNYKHKIIYFLPNEIIQKRYGSLQKNIFSGIELFPLFPPELKFKKPEIFDNQKFNIFIAPGSNFTELFNQIILKTNNFAKNNNFKIFLPIKLDFGLKNIFYVDGSKGFQNYIYYSDLVICAAGNVMLETLYFKYKIIAYSTNDNQITLINYLEERNRVFNLKNIDLLSEELILNYSFHNKQFLRNQNQINFNCDKLLDIIFNK